MALNIVILFGRLTRDPEFRQTQSGTPVCRFTVACDRKFANKQTGEREADFIDCTAWNKTAEFVSRYFMKGSPITVEGTIRNNNYEDQNGVKHYSYVVLAEQVGFAGKKEDSRPQESYAPHYDTVPNYRTNSPNNPPQAAQPAQEAISIGDLGEFEEILSDGDVPF